MILPSPQSLLLPLLRGLAAAAALALALDPSAAHAALGEPAQVRFAPAPDALPLVEAGRAAPVVVDPADWPGVLRAAGDFRADVGRVSGVEPQLLPAPPASGEELVLAGTLGRSPLLDGLVRSGKLDVSGIRGQWESWVTAVVAAPFPGVRRALVIAGSDKRGTIYGLYDISEQLGVSPWYWWDDVVPAHHDSAYFLAGRTLHGPPAVKYRGIFLNDEAPDLTRWVIAKFGRAAVSQHPPVPPGVPNYGHEFYARIFEVLLRLRANYLWPAMWANAFNEDDPENPKLADEYGIVMGTSHQEPMMRAQEEWDRRYLSTLGHWNYARYPEVMEEFWRAGIRRNHDFENVVTIGLRGANDTPMAGGGPAANQALLEHIVDRQRSILAAAYPRGGPPQLWCLYKEVQDYYEHGMRVPGDVTLLWADDNWGNLRRVPSAAERARPGGAGIYYHFDYHGGPRCYQWINANPLPKIWDQMSLAHEYGADRVWIVNVGHFKGYEVPTEFFLNLAWNPGRWNGGNLHDFLRDWAAREFGPEHAGAIAEIVAGYAQDNGRRKPELLAPDTYSLVNFHEAERVVAQFDALTRRAEALDRLLPASKRDAFYELVLFPTQASALLNRLYLAAGRNALFAEQGRASASHYADRTRQLFHQFEQLMAYYNGPFAGGRWSHFMDQPVLGYTGWRDPPVNSLRAIPLVTPAIPPAAALGVAVEGAREAWPGAPGRPALPLFDAFNRQTHDFTVFDRGAAPFPFTAEASEPWIVLSQNAGTVGADTRVEVRIDWGRAPRDHGAGVIRVRGAGAEVRMEVSEFNPAAPARDAIHGYVDAAGYISIEPEHAAANISSGRLSWTRIAGYGRTLSGMRADGPVDFGAAPGGTSARLEYPAWFFHPGPVTVTVITSPSLACIPGKPVRYAVSFDDQPPTSVTLVPGGDALRQQMRAWARWVTDNAAAGQSRHVLNEAGRHTLKLWLVDPGIVVQKILIAEGGLPPTYLGPPETFHR
ncbi:MAG TPA: glycosyl hydrolase 115 family protein [Opitutaceae bacterium]|jgi:hypothetical protein|nr:glycosyl hydrolase 115 family protein [Opitutaceae bacterium]